MADPFAPSGPTCVSFSGGRTSAYMLWRILDANGGLPPDTVVCFANTGKEDEATLRFVHEVETRWVPINWVEYRNDAGYALVDFATATLPPGAKFEPYPQPVTLWDHYAAAAMQAYIMKGLSVIAVDSAGRTRRRNAR